MTRLKIELNRGRNRWIFSVFCTFALFFTILAVPLWNFQNQGNASEPAVEKSVSLVSVAKRKKKAVPVQKTAPAKKVEKKLNVPKKNVIPRKPKVEEKIEASEEKIVENVSEAAPVEDVESSAENAESSSENALPGPVLSDSEKKALASYKSYALGRIASKKVYPYPARSKGLEGKVRVRIVINPDGNVSETEILEKSEHEILNEACLAAVKKASPFKKMKKGQNAMTLTFTMDFSLEKK